MFSVNKIIRYIRQNKKIIMITVGIIVGVAFIVQILNGIAKGILENGSRNEEQKNNNTNTSSLYQPNKTILSNTTIKESTAKENTEIIDKFIEYCNNGDTENAYNLLTEECREVLYKNIDSFKNNYYNKIFKERKEYNIQSWITYDNSYTYKVRFTENLLATGKSNNNTIEDYITIVNDNNNIGLNINSYVAREKLDKEVKNDNIIIKIRYKDIYIDKEAYCINVTNNSENEIMLDSLKTSTGIKLVGNNDTTYQALTNELGKYDVTVPSRNTKTIKIKFIKEYNQRRIEKQILFTNIILDTKKFAEDSNDENNKTSINVEL